MSAVNNLGGNQPTVVLDEIAEVVAGYLGRRFKKHEIREALKTEWSLECSPRSLEALLARARVLMIQRSSAPKETHFSNAIEFYEAIIKDESVKPEARITAQSRLDNLLGLERQFTASAEGTADEQAAAARDALKKMKEADSGE